MSDHTNQPVTPSDFLISKMEAMDDVVQVLIVTRSKSGEICYDSCGQMAADTRRHEELSKALTKSTAASESNNARLVEVLEGWIKGTRCWCGGGPFEEGDGMCWRCAAEQALAHRELDKPSTLTRLALSWRDNYGACLGREAALLRDCSALTVRLQIAEANNQILAETMNEFRLIGNKTLFPSVPHPVNEREMYQLGSQRAFGLVAEKAQMALLRLSE